MISDVITKDIMFNANNIVIANKKLDKDPTSSIIAQNTKILVEKSNISSKIKSTLKPTNPLPPRLPNTDYQKYTNQTSHSDC